jgi:hypothetical protein
MECKGEISLIKNDSYLECLDSIMGDISEIERNTTEALDTLPKSFIDKVGSGDPLFPPHQTTPLNLNFKTQRS